MRSFFAFFKLLLLMVVVGVVVLFGMKNQGKVDIDLVFLESTVSIYIWLLFFVSFFAGVLVAGLCFFMVSLRRRFSRSSKKSEKSQSEDASSS